MRTKRFIDGLNNSQKIRVIVDGVGFHTTVAGAFNMVFSSQQKAVTMALLSLGLSQGNPFKNDPVTGIARTYTVYGEDDKKVDVNVQVDLV
jgi:hypothetical protein